MCRCRVCTGLQRMDHGTRRGRSRSKGFVKQKPKERSDEYECAFELQWKLQGCLRAVSEGVRDQAGHVDDLWRGSWGRARATELEGQGTAYVHSAGRRDVDGLRYAAGPLDAAWRVSGLCGNERSGRGEADLQCAGRGWEYSDAARQDVLVAAVRHVHG